MRDDELDAWVVDGPIGYRRATTTFGFPVTRVVRYPLELTDPLRVGVEGCPQGSCEGGYGECVGRGCSVGGLVVVPCGVSHCETYDRSIENGERDCMNIIDDMLPR